MSAVPITRDPTAYSLTLPPRYRGIYLRAISGNRPAARKAMCLECQGWSEGAVAAIRNCPTIACPNHTVRPYQVEMVTRAGEKKEETVEVVTVDEVTGEVRVDVEVVTVTVPATVDRAKLIMSEERLKKLEEARKARTKKGGAG